ncbi:MAG: Fic family protein [Granulosicoccus sp.]
MNPDDVGYWLTAESVREIHEDLFHPARAPGERRERPIDAVLASVESRFHYGDDDPTDVPLVASVYASAIARAHSFHDGNKRTAFAVMLTYLDDCGFMLDLPDDDTLVPVMVNVASGALTEYQLRDVIAAYVAPE